MYRSLLHGKAVTRATVALETGLSVPTVSTIIQDFERLNLTNNVGEARPRGGRPAKLSQFNPEARSVLSVDLSGARAQAARVNLWGDAEDLPAGPPVKPHSDKELISWIAGLAQSQQQFAVSKIALAVPGVIDQTSGHVRLAPALGWTDFALSEWLSAETGLDTILENDVNALALAELHYGSGASFQHILFIWIDRGVGASLIVNRALYRGASSAAGEIGYSLLPNLAGETTLGAPGPLEDYLLSVSRRFRNATGELDLSTQDAQAGFEEFTATVGLVLHNLVCLLNPSLVIIGWPADPQGLLVERLRTTWRGPLEVALRRNSLGEQAVLRGAARIALDVLEQELCRTFAPEL